MEDGLAARQLYRRLLSVKLPASPTWRVYSADMNADMYVFPRTHASIRFKKLTTDTQQVSRQSWGNNWADACTFSVI